MLHVVHGDGVDHDDSVVLPGEERAGAMTEEKGSGNGGKKAKERESYCSRPSAGPPFSTSEMTMEVSPL